MPGVGDVWIVQHAEKEPGDAEPADPGLTERGRRQARRAAAHLWEVGPFDLLCSSPLRRARQTAEALAERLGLSVLVDDRLRERMNWGAAPVGSPSALAESVDEFLREWRHATRDRDYVPASGDSSRATGERFRLLLEELAVGAGERAFPPVLGPLVRRAVVVSHGGVTVDLLRTLFGDGAVRDAAPDAIERGIPSCGITRLARRASAWELVGLGDIAHLAGEESDWGLS